MSTANAKYRLHHMSGNVTEWCRDTYQENVYRSRAGTVTEDPWVQGEGPHSARSSSFKEQPLYGRISRRRPLASGDKEEEVGFRVYLKIK